MINDKVVVLTRELVDEILAVLSDSTERWDLTGTIREQMNRKDEPLFNSPTFAEEPLTRKVFLEKVGRCLDRWQFSFDDFADRAMRDLDESGPWVKTFWENGISGLNEEGCKLPCSTGTYWDESSQTGLIYFSLPQHEIVTNHDLSVIKVRKDCSLLDVVHPWVEWKDESQWLSSSVNDLERAIEDWF